MMYHCVRSILSAPLFPVNITDYQVEPNYICLVGYPRGCSLYTQRGIIAVIFHSSILLSARRSTTCKFRLLRITRSTSIFSPAPLRELARLRNRFGHIPCPQAHLHECTATATTAAAAATTTAATAVNCRFSGEGYGLLFYS